MENGPSFEAERMTKTIKFIGTSLDDLKKGVQTGANRKLCNEYENFLLEEINLEKNEEALMNAINEGLEEKLETQSGKDILLNMQADINLNEKILQSNQDEIRKITFQDFANRQSYKNQFEERKREIELHYSETVAKMTAELESAVKEHKLLEEKLKGQNAVEIGKKNIQLKEVKTTFQKNIADKQGVLLNLVKEVNELRKTLEDLKAKKNEAQFNSRRQNVLQFEPSIPISTSRSYQPTKDTKLTDTDNDTLAQSMVHLNKSAVNSMPEVNNVPLAKGVINSSQKPITVTKTDSNTPDDPWTFNETASSQLSSNSRPVNARKLPKVYTKSREKKIQPLAKSYQSHSK